MSEPFPELEALIDHLTSPEIMAERKIMEEKIASVFYRIHRLAINEIEFWGTING